MSSSLYSYRNLARQRKPVSANVKLRRLDYRPVLHRPLLFGSYAELAMRALPLDSQVWHRRSSARSQKAKVPIRDRSATYMQKIAYAKAPLVSIGCHEASVSKRVPTH